MDGLTVSPSLTRPQAAPILNEAERQGMRRAGEFNSQLFDFLRDKVKSNVTTGELNRIAHEYTLDHGHTPACLGYRGYPRSICTSVNEVVCHGIPSDDALRDGDLVNIDLTTIVDGWHGDQSETFLIGSVTEEARRLTQVTFDCLHRGIEAARPGESAYLISEAIQGHAHQHGFSVVREYQGHGIGQRFHQQPKILHYATPLMKNVFLTPGICFTLEPMINAGGWRTILDRNDQWTVRTTDGRLSAQFEHTILMTEQGPEILTQSRDGPRPGHRF